MHSPRRIRLALLVALMLCVPLLPAAPAAARTVAAKRLLGELSVTAERGAASYERDFFADWYDADSDGCDTRQEVLIAESRTTADRNSSCDVTSGTWFSYYDAKTWTDPSELHVDHVVALAEAWRSGARKWSERRRDRFANDLRFGPSLQAVTARENLSKGDSDPDDWLPDRARCKYAVRWVQVKYRWRLRIDRSERAALGGLLDGDCGRRDVKVPRRAR